MSISNRPLDILVIGAGIAGLSAAIALGKQGHRVVILEKSAFLREAGAAIHLPPNCTALLKWMGVDPVEFGGTLLSEIHRYGAHGDLEYKKEFDSVRHSWQAEWYLVHRVDLHNHLKNRAIETATLHTQCHIHKVELQGPRPSVRLSDGRSFDGDLLIGADGLHSQVRSSVAPDAPGAYPVGTSCFRWLLPTDQLRQHDDTMKFVQQPGVFIDWSSEDRRLVAYPCSDNQVFNLCAFVPSSEARAETVDNDWQANGNKSSIQRAFSNFPSGVWDLYDMPGLPTWTRGHAAVIGDAAHPFQPFMGQGAAMAIEDAVSIATLLPCGTPNETVPTRLQMYETSRRPRYSTSLERMQQTRMTLPGPESAVSLHRIHENGLQADIYLAAEMVKFMGICFSYNEIEHSQTLLQNESNASTNMR
ncbi:hypothetical protein N7452_006818 [Penicillium brevicompactum]|uniref:FAD-binding domain-containing protein n=1 Tax=Penicillium brevicompactum TaxID=5074 RepID=A0A9W9QMM6_PENBR|nr:hypothetical protein N7452_006818 [Penicillium brevicompactum]